jgi:uncharacterized protein (TIGR02145 family)
MKKIIFTVCIIFSIITITYSQQQNPVMDIDSNIYKTIKIGNQIWFAQNLRTKRLNDKTKIPKVKDSKKWNNFNSAAYCIYNDEDTITEDFGLLYNWYAVETGKLCPNGWHVPSKDDWSELEDYLIANGYNFDGSLKSNKIAPSLSQIDAWGDLNKPGVPGKLNTNKSAFSAFPAGVRQMRTTTTNIGGEPQMRTNSINNNQTSDGWWEYSGRGVSTSWWTSSGFGLYATYWTLCQETYRINGIPTNRYFYNLYIDKNQGYSIRCLKD